MSGLSAGRASRCRLRLLVALLGALLAIALSIRVAQALFTRTASNGGNTFTTDTLTPPTNLTATVSCSSGAITVNWTATTKTYASGHRVLRGTSSGGPYSQIAQVTPRTTTTYIDNPAAGTYYYVVRAYYQNWESVNSNEASATTPVTCSGPNYAGAVGTNAWLTPANAVGSDETSCADSGYTLINRVGFWNTYGFAIPSGSTIRGVRVEVKASWFQDPPTGITINIGKNETTLGTAKAVTTLTSQTCGATQTIHSFGGSADLWGLSWTPAEINSSGFTVRINHGTGESRIFVNWIRVTVAYTPP